MSTDKICQGEKAIRRTDEERTYIEEWKQVQDEPKRWFRQAVRKRFQAAAE